MCQLWDDVELAILESSAESSSDYCDPSRVTEDLDGGDLFDYYESVHGDLFKEAIECMANEKAFESLQK